MSLTNQTLEAYNDVRNCRDKRSICHAPGYSMYFGRDGLVTACCYNRSNPLGRYPDQTIGELWTGDKIGNMRRQMLQNLLPKGCETCADQLRAHNFKGLLAAQFDSFAHDPSDAVDDYPARMEFELSNKCNLECSMCNGFFSSSIRSNREGLPALPQIYDRRFVEQLRPFVPHLKEATFFGGEPFLIDLYYEMWELFIELNPACHVVITTNGTVFTQKVRRVLENLNCQIIVSIDSLDKGNYERIRRNAVLERTLDNLDSFAAINRRRNKPLWLAVCPMVTNWRELPEIISFANRKEMLLFFNTVTFPKELSLKHLGPREHEELSSLLRQTLRTPANPTEENNYRALQDLCRQVEAWMEEQPVPPPNRIKDQCGLYLKRFRSEEGAHMYSVLAALATPNPGLVTFRAPVICDESDARQNIREHYTAVWKVGRMLTCDGTLTGAAYSENDLQTYLKFLETTYPGTTLNEIYEKSMSYLMEVLLLAGASTAEEFIELTRTHYAVGAAIPR